MIASIRAVARRLAQARQRVTDTEEKLADTIRGALAEGERVADIAEAAGISRQRVYQIRDGRR